MGYNFTTGVILGVIATIMIIAIIVAVFLFILLKDDKERAKERAKEREELRKRAYEAIEESNEEYYYKNTPKGIEIQLDKSKLTNAELRLIDNGYAPDVEYDDVNDVFKFNDNADTRFKYIRYYNKTDTGDCFVIDNNQYNPDKQIRFCESTKRVYTPDIDAAINSAITERFHELGWA